MLGANGSRQKEFVLSQARRVLKYGPAERLIGPCLLVISLSMLVFAGLLLDENEHKRSMPWTWLFLILGTVFWQINQQILQVRRYLTDFCEGAGSKENLREDLELGAISKLTMVSVALTAIVGVTLGAAIVLLMRWLSN